MFRIYCLKKEKLFILDFLRFISQEKGNKLRGNFDLLEIFNANK